MEFSGISPIEDEYETPHTLKNTSSPCGQTYGERCLLAGGDFALPGEGDCSELGLPSCSTGMVRRCRDPLPPPPPSPPPKKKTKKMRTKDDDRYPLWLLAVAAGRTVLFLSFLLLLLVFSCLGVRIWNFGFRV